MVALCLSYHAVLPMIVSGVTADQVPDIGLGDWADTASARTAPNRSDGAREKASGHEREP